MYTQRKNSLLPPALIVTAIGIWLFMPARMNIKAEKSFVFPVVATAAAITALRDRF